MAALSVWWKADSKDAYLVATKAVLTVAWSARSWAGQKALWMAEWTGVTKAAMSVDPKVCQWVGLWADSMAGSKVGHLAVRWAGL